MSARQHKARAGRKRASAAAAGSAPINDTRAELIDSLFRRTLYFAQYLGFSPAALLERFTALVQAMPPQSLPRESLREGRSFAATHAGPEIMRVWNQELEFLDAQGRARPLPLSGAAPNFSDLVKRATPGVETATALADLLAAAAVQIDTQGLLVPRTWAVTFGGVGRRAEAGLYSADNLLAALENNLLQSDAAKRYLQCEAVCVRFARAELPRAQRYLKQQAAVHLEQADEWLHRYEADPAAPAEDMVTVILGSYLSVRDPKPSSPPRAPARKAARKQRR